MNPSICLMAITGQLHAVKNLTTQLCVVLLPSASHMTTGIITVT
ncbi:hypothetical protein AA0114_g8323 [Alternaria tenuissima]|uniref:Uncharacterized protein n=1 Tax=Alternaria tenuissima TaxID=119927 RepID=A0A4Q4MC60_9PLEO|nr:hypothetical protein AA0114_g8323 [Alternaria tenuissima]